MGGFQQGSPAVLSNTSESGGTFMDVRKGQLFFKLGCDAAGNQEGHFL